MATFNLPDLGEGLAEAEIVEWHVKPGDEVRADQPMVSMETAKAVVEVPVPFNGIVTALHGAVGDVIPTGAPLVEFDSGTVVGAMPAATGKEFVDSATIGRAAPSDPLRRRALPAARALARHLGLELTSIEGKGPAGLIRLDDVLAHASTAGPLARSDAGAARDPSGNGECASTAHGSARASGLVVPAGASTEPLRGMRRAMALSMSISHAHVPGSTVCDDADIHGWAQPGDYTLRLIRAMIAACAAEPALNAWYDSASNARILMSRIDLAIAVDTAAGLIVPVLRDVRGKTPAELRAAIAAAKDAAHRRATPPEDLRGFTLTLSNFGTLAGRYGVPLVVPPAVAILGCGKARFDAVVRDGTVAARRRVPLSLSFDHRCVTGGEACRFLAAAIADLELAE